jgi:Ca2+-transporting ATPase
MDQRGLTSHEAASRLGKYGRNEIQDKGRISLIRILARQVQNNFVIYLLLGAMILSFFVEKAITGYTLGAIIIIVVALGFVQEYRAENALTALRGMITPVSIIIRDGKQQEIESHLMVPGDIVLLRTGERVPADCMVLEENELRVNESILTGESGEVKKIVVKNEDEVKDTSTLFAGSFITSGRAVAQVIETGMRTKFGAIANLVSKEEKELPLQNKVNHMTKYLVVLSLVFAILTGLVFLLRSGSLSSEVLVEMTLIMIALAVSAFPESYPVVLITTLSAGTYRMARKNAIVNRMSVVETLGETTVICSDKTGTLTKGEMTVKKVFADSTLFEVSGAGYNADGMFSVDNHKHEVSKDKVLSLLCKAAVVCNDASITRTGEDNDYSIVGTPTEASLLVMAAKAGFFKDDLNVVRKEEIPFSSERKRMSVLVNMDKKPYVFTKGAAELVVEQCVKVHRADGIFTLTDSQKKKLLELISSLNAQAYRTLALAYANSPKLDKTNGEKDLIFLGLVALEDPPREEVVQALQECKRAGISVKMITGDNKDTAMSIAQQIGLQGTVLTGADMDKLSDDELTYRVLNVTIFARVRPEHKLRIVNALKNKGEVVTMTGDGINDAPALKAAHIGVAMGKTGTDVSRSVADITLKDDNFSTIVAAVREGRTIFNNMRKFITYQLSGNCAQMIVLFLGIAIGLPLPLVAIQILFMNMVTDDLPAITLGLNPSSDDVMDRKPRRRAPLLNREIIGMLTIAGVIMGFGTLGVFYYSLNVMGNALEVARTTALVTLIAFMIANAFNFRSFRKPVLTRSPFANRALVWASIISALATVAIIQTPIHLFFETVPLTRASWALALIPALFVVIVFDILKHLNEKKHFWVDLN